VTAWHGRLLAILVMASLVLSVAAMVLALTHGGPAGPPGPAGAAGHSAHIGHLGVCWSLGQDIQSGNDPAFQNALTPPLAADGAVSCPAGVFVSVVPQG
jgi:hypothetical protein